MVRSWGPQVWEITNFKACNNLVFPHEPWRQQIWPRSHRSHNAFTQTKTHDIYGWNIPTYSNPAATNFHVCMACFQQRQIIVLEGWIIIFKVLRCSVNFDFRMCKELNVQSFRKALKQIVVSTMNDSTLGCKIFMFTSKPCSPENKRETPHSCRNKLIKLHPCQHFPNEEQVGQSSHWQNLVWSKYVPWCKWTPGRQSVCVDDTSNNCL